MWDRDRADGVRIRAHDNRVTAIALGPAGRAITTSTDSTARVWNLTRIEKDQPDPWHSRVVTGAAVAPDEQLGLTASEDGVRVWDLACGRLVRSGNAHARWTKGVALLPGRPAAATFGTDGDVYDPQGAVRIWDVADGHQLGQLGRGSSKDLQALALSPDGRLAATAFHIDDLMDHTHGLELWDIATGERLGGRSVEDGSLSTRALAFAADSERVLVALRDRISIRNVSDLEECGAFDAHGATVETIAAAEHADIAVSGDAKGVVRVWSPDTGHQLAAFAAHRGTVECVAVDPNGRRAVSTGYDHALVLWDLDARQALATYTVDSDLNACAIGASGECLIAGDDLGHVHILHYEAPAAADETPPWVVRSSAREREPAAERDGTDDEEISPEDRALALETVGGRLVHSAWAAEALRAIDAAVERSDADPRARARALAARAICVSDDDDDAAALAAIEAAIDAFDAIGAPEPLLRDLLETQAFYLAAAGQAADGLAAVRHAIAVDDQLAADEPEQRLGLQAHEQRLLGECAADEASARAGAALAARVAEPGLLEPDVADDIAAGALEAAAAGWQGLGRLDEAAEAVAETIRLLRRLARRRLQVLLAELDQDQSASARGRADACLHEAEQLINADALEQARRLVDEALTVYRAELAAARGDPSAALGASLVLKTVLAGRTGDHDGAVAAVIELVELLWRPRRRQLDALLLDLARSLMREGEIRTGLEREPQARGSVEEAVTLYRRLLVAGHSWLRPELAHALDLRVEISDPADDWAHVDALQDAISANRELVHAGHAEFRPALAAALVSLAAWRGERGSWIVNALDCAVEAVTLYRELADQEPGAFAFCLADALDVEGVALTNERDLTAAGASLGEAAALFRQLARQGVDGALPRLADVTRQHAASSEDPVLAIMRLTEALTLYRQLASDDPHANHLHVATTGHALATALGASGRIPEAAATMAEAIAAYQSVDAPSNDDVVERAAACGQQARWLSELGRADAAADAAAGAVDALQRPSPTTPATSCATWSSPTRSTASLRRCTRSPTSRTGHSAQRRR